MMDAVGCPQEWDAGAGSLLDRAAEVALAEAFSLQEMRPALGLKLFRQGKKYLTAQTVMFAIQAGFKGMSSYCFGSRNLVLV